MGTSWFTKNSNRWIYLFDFIPIQGSEKDMNCLALINYFCYVYVSCDHVSILYKDIL